MKRILFTGTLAALFAMSLFSNQAQAGDGALKMFTDTDGDAEALASEFKDRHDYNALMAVKLADVATDEKGQHDLVPARQFIMLAEEYAAKARGAK